jgi:glyoxylase-like metal-dependent hydrolase (beta-lactamase superfamily II)
MRSSQGVLFFFALFVFNADCFAQATTPTATSAVLPFELKLIGPNIWAAIDNPKGDAGANAGFVVGDDGVLVIDTFENEAAAKALMTEIHRLTHLPVKFVVNTHYHLDHVAGNRVFAQEGAAVVAQHSVRTWIHTENLKFFGDKIKPEEKKLVENLWAPEVTYNEALSLYLGNRRIDVTFMDGHTGGDSVVNIPDAGVAFCGDLFWNKTLPNLIDANTTVWDVTLHDILALPVQSRTDSPPQNAAIFVPGHGDVGKPADVRDFQQYLSDLRTMVANATQAGKSGDELVSAVLPQLAAKYGSWNFYKYFSRSNILDMASEIQGSKKVPVREKK